MADPFQKQSLLSPSAHSPGFALPSPYEPQTSGSPSNRSKDRITAPDSWASSGYAKVPVSDLNGTSSAAQPSPGLEKFDEVHDYHAMRQEDLALKKRIRYLRFAFRIASLLLSLYMVIAMSLTLHIFLSSRHHLVDVYDVTTGKTSRGPWAAHTTYWPTVLLLTTSSVSLLLDLLIMTAYTKSIEAANMVGDYGTYITFGIGAAHVALWIATAIAYRKGKTGNDLWGWSCDPRARRIQPIFTQQVDFHLYCELQTNSWYTSLAQAALVVVYSVISAIAYRRLKHQRDMENRFSGTYSVKETRWSKLIPTGHSLPKEGNEGNDTT